jgi:hypothetical protein
MPGLAIENLVAKVSVLASFQRDITLLGIQWVA